jgi:choline-phosphate cytidylyltransferase
MENIGEKRVDMIQKWEEKSRDFIETFLLLFGREGRLVSSLHETFGHHNSQPHEKKHSYDQNS